MNVDPLRVRIRFLGALTADERRAVIQEAQAKLHEHLEAMQGKARRDQTSGDVFGRLVTRGAILSVRAQSSCLAEVQEALLSQ